MFSKCHDYQINYWYFCRCLWQSTQVWRKLLLTFLTKNAFFLILKKIANVWLMKFLFLLLDQPDKLTTRNHWTQMEQSILMKLILLLKLKKMIYSWGKKLPYGKIMIYSWGKKSSYGKIMVIYTKWDFELTHKWYVWLLQ